MCILLVYYVVNFIDFIEVKSTQLCGFSRNYVPEMLKYGKQKATYLRRFRAICILPVYYRTYKKAKKEAPGNAEGFLFIAFLH